MFKKFVFLGFLLTIFYYNVFSQTSSAKHQLIVNIGNPDISECSGDLILSGSFHANGESHSFYNTNNTSVFHTFEFNSFPSNSSIYVTYSLACDEGPFGSGGIVAIDGGTIFLNLDGSCNLQTVNSGVMQFQARYIPPRYSKPVFNVESSITCDEVSLSTVPTVPSSTYNWEVSDNPSVGGSWRQVRNSSISNVNISYQDLISAYSSNDVFGRPHYFRVKPASSSCSGFLQSVASEPVTFYRPIPELKSTDIEALPPSSSCTGDGGIKINTLKYPDGSNYNGDAIIFSISNPGGTEVYNVNFSGTLPLEIRKTGFFFTDENDYWIQVENGVEVGQNSCTSDSINFKVPTAPAFSIGEPSLGKAVSCNGGGDGEISISVFNGKPPFMISILKDGVDFINMPSQTSRDVVISNLSVGSYEVKVIDDCNDVKTSAPLSISEPTIITVAISNKTDVLCKDAANGSISLGATGGGSGTFTYSINDGVSFFSSPNFTGLLAGDYIVQVKKGDCLSEKQTVIIGEPTSNVSVQEITKSNFNGFNTQCSNEYGGTGSITITGTGGVAPYQYSINNGISFQTASTFSAMSAGNYEVVIRDANSCLTEPQTVNLSAPPELSVIAVVSQELSCAGSNDAEITVSGTGGVGGLQYSINNGVDFVSVDVFSSLSAGTYIVKVRDLNNCEEFTADPIIIDNPDSLIINSSISNPISCFGESDGAIEVSVTNIVGEISYSWTKNGMAFANTKDISGLSEGTYELTVSDSKNCPVSKEVILSQPALLQTDSQLSNFSGFNISCNGASDGQIQIDPFGGTAPYTYLWSTGATTSTLENLIAGNYSVTITDANGCTINENFTLTEPEVLEMQPAQITNVNCNGDFSGEVILNALGGAGTNTYSIDGINFQGSNIFNGLGAGDYTFLVKDANNCQDVINLSITEPSSLSATLVTIEDASCGELNGRAVVEASGGVVPYSYSWTDNNGTEVGTSATLSNVGAGIYTALITDQNGCILESSEAIITSIDGAQLSIESVVSTTCFDTADGQANISISGYGPFEVEWANGETGTNAVNLVAGLNTVSITDVNGCVVVEQVNIPSPDPITITVIENITPTCNTSLDGSIAVNIVGGTGEYDIMWSNGNTNSSLEGLASGTYSISVTDENGCSATQNINIEEKAPVSLEITEVITPSCVGSTDGSLTINAIGGNGGYSYIWDNGSQVNTLSNIGAGAYSVLIIDAAGCTYQEIIEFEDPEPFEILVDYTWEICTGSSFFTNYSIPGAISYNWSSVNGFESDERKVEIKDPGIYQLTIENENGCIATKDFELIVSNDLLSADMIMASEAYVGDTVMVIDISWPIPDSVYWQIPEGVTILEQNMDFTSIIFTEPGNHDLSIEIAQAECRDYYTQSISILPVSEREEENQRIFDSPEKLIKSFNVFPNPAIRDFKVNIELTQKHYISLKMVDLSGNSIVFSESYKESDNYSIPMSKVLKPGVYIISLQVGKESTYKRIVIR